MTGDRLTPAAPVAHAIDVGGVPLAGNVPGRTALAARAFGPILPMQMVDSVGAILCPATGEWEDNPDYQGQQPL